MQIHSIRTEEDLLKFLIYWNARQVENQTITFDMIYFSFQRENFKLLIYPSDVVILQLLTNFFSCFLCCFLQGITWTN